MEIKKSHKADLEHLRPWMFLAGLLLPLLVFVVVMEVRMVKWNFSDDDDYEDVTMDLDLKDEQRDMIAAAQKEEEKEATELNKVDKVVELVPKELELVKFEPGEDATIDELQKEEEKPININDDDPEIKLMVEELPEYPGGMVEFVKWLTANLRYPTSAISSKIQGKVMISFVVETDGSISSLKVEEPVHKLLDGEALRVARMMPNWKPAKDKGKICRCKVAIPIVFEI